MSVIDLFAKKRMTWKCPGRQCTPTREPRFAEQVRKAETH
jgi:hypothetical protein